MLQVQATVASFIIFRRGALSYSHHAAAAAAVMTSHSDGPDPHTADRCYCVAGLTPGAGPNNTFCTPAAPWMMRQRAHARTERKRRRRQTKRAARAIPSKLMNGPL